MLKDTVSKNDLNVSQIFQTYITFCGDTKRTALAMDIDEQTIKDLASDERWVDKIAEWNELREGDPRDVQIQINRAVNYVQAHRLRAVLDRVVSHLSTMTGEELVELLTRRSKDAKQFWT